MFVIFGHDFEDSFGAARAPLFLGWFRLFWQQHEQTGRFAVGVSKLYWQ